MKWISILSGLVFLLFAGMVWGQECTVTATTVSFGDYNTFSGSPLDATGGVSASCDTAIPFAVKFDQGQNSGGNFDPREMGTTPGTDSIRYNIYRDSARQEIWGDGTGNTFIHSGTGTGRTIPLTVYGRIPARQNISVGSYSDLVTVIVEW